MNTEEKIAFLREAAVICPTDDESMRIDLVDDDGNVHCEGEETGESYSLDLSEIDFKNWIFYKFEKMECPE
jgi:hypothetical protein